MALDDLCLASQDIAALISSGQLTTTDARIQPSSFEPRLGDKVFVLDAESGVLRPSGSDTVYRSLLQLPRRQRRCVDISDGFVVQAGHSYLFPLEETLRFGGLNFMESSPKSTFGRLFLHSRMMTDYNASFDVALARDSPDVALRMWLLVQPRVFDVVVYPGLSLNQLRFFTGPGAKLSASEIVDEWQRNPLLYQLDDTGELVATDPILDSRGLRVHLDVLGRRTHGIVGLRARRTPFAVDTARLGHYDAEDFFEPLEQQNGRVVLEPGEHYLMSSLEVFSLPAHLNMQLQRHSPVGLAGSVDDAGFIDNGFVGDLVAEVSSHEKGKLVCSHGDPFSGVDVFRTPTSEILYGAEIGSHYAGQVGPRVSKFHKSFDFARAAKNYGKLDRDVLVVPARELTCLRREPFGFEPCSDASVFLSVLESGFYLSRYDCEDDELLLQPIPYGIVFGPDGTVFSYVRAESIEDYGDERLFGKHSIGVGGHINRVDFGDASSCFERELAEEVRCDGEFKSPTFLGTLVADDTPVDRVHFGLIYGVHATGPVSPNESSVASGRLTPLNSVVSQQNGLYETWSRLLVPHLPALYQMSRT